MPLSFEKVAQRGASEPLCLHTPRTLLGSKALVRKDTSHNSAPVQLDPIPMESVDSPGAIW